MQRDAYSDSYLQVDYAMVTEPSRVRRLVSWQGPLIHLQNLRLPDLGVGAGQLPRRPADRLIGWVRRHRFQATKRFSKKESRRNIYTG